MIYKYDTHMHTSEGSACSNSTAYEMADKFKSEGYTGIIVTNHFFNGNTSVPYDLPWKERIERYNLGYEKAKERGEQIGLDVFFGFEYGNGQADFLVYGLDAAWLYEHPEILDMTCPEFIDFAHKYNGFVVHAHPFRMENYIHSFTLCPRYEDAVEIVNASNRLSSFNDHAKEYAKWYNLPVTAGSDSHNTSNRFFPGGIAVDYKFKSVNDYIDAVKNGKIIELLDSKR